MAKTIIELFFLFEETMAIAASGNEPVPDYLYSY